MQQTPRGLDLYQWRPEAHPAFMELPEVRRVLSLEGIEITHEARMPDGHGWRLECRGGEIVNVYDTGRVVAQGRRMKEVGQLFMGPSREDAARVPQPSRQSVFVVYGHDRPTRDALEAMLLRWGLEPLILENLPSEGDTVIEKLERYTRETIHFAVVLATPDDVGYPAVDSSHPRPRARQNVVLELGMLLAKLGRRKVAILLKEGQDMEKPSDISGLIYIGYRDSLDEVKLRLAREMEGQGIHLRVGSL